MVLMKVQFYLLTLVLLLFTLNNNDKEFDFKISYLKASKKNTNILLANNEFKAFPKSKSLGRKNGTYWFKLVLNKKLNNENLTAFIPTHNIERIDVYKFENNQLNYLVSTGNAISKKQLPIDYKFPAFKINDSNNSVYYLKVKFPKEANFPIRILSEKKFISFIMEKKTINSLYYGTALAIILLNLFLFFRFKDKIHLFYLFFLTSLMINFLLYDGSLINTFRGNKFFYKLEMIIHLSNEIWFLLFSIKFLNLHKNHPKLTRAFFLFPVAVAFFYTLNLTTNNFTFIAIADTLGIALFPILWCLGIYYIKQMRYVKFYVFGYLLLIPFAVYFIIGYPYGLWNVNGEMLIIKLASWLDIIILTYAISYKIKIEKHIEFNKQIKELNTEIPSTEQPKLVDSYYSLLKENTLEIRPLTLREIDILDLICEGLNNIEIGDRLFISRNTVKYHIKNIYIKAKVNSRNELKEKLSQRHNC